MKKSLAPLVLLVGYVVGARAQKIMDEPLPQVLLVYNHKEPNGMYVVEAKSKVILALRPTDPEAHLAPIEKNTLMLCRPLSVTGSIVFRCGSDKFVVANMNFLPEDK